MFIKSVVFLAFVALARTHDIAVGFNTDGRKIFDETKQANPAIWRQASNDTVNAQEGEVISRVVVKDQRPEKDGDAKIVEGGEGHKNVTIELKSPTALRGYDFKIEVYAAPDVHKDLPEDMNVNMDVKHPKDIGLDMKFTTESNTDSTTEVSNGPTLASKDDFTRSARNAMNEGTNKNMDNTVTVHEQSTIDPDCTTDIPIEKELKEENMKTAKDAQDHEIVDFVLDMNDSAKEALVSASLTEDDMGKLNNRTTEDMSTTESSDIESTTLDQELTTMAENKYDKLEPMDQDMDYSKIGEQDQNSFKVPFVVTRNEENKKLEKDVKFDSSPL
ncbi:unnamed protein product [Leptosia nina]|uniref:Uncharacterized protein n=1 Tax=Leptosia nina TaxID=320188 RepID=A0AAV1JF39_9NEOP